MLRFHRKSKGFTLIELMIVVAIIGILAAIAIPRFANLIDRAREARTQGNLGSLRSALAIAYGSSDGVWPATLLAMTAAVAPGPFIDVIPDVVLPGAMGHAEVATEDAVMDHTGDWYYTNVAAGGDAAGTCRVDCAHADSGGDLVSTW